MRMRVRAAPRTGAMDEEASERVERMRSSLLSCRLTRPQVSLTEAAPRRRFGTVCSEPVRFFGVYFRTMCAESGPARVGAGPLESGSDDADQKARCRIACLTSAMALVISMPRGQASVQLKVVRQRHTPSLSLRISRRMSPPSSRESKMKRCAVTLAAGPKYCPSVQNTGHDEVQAAQRMHFVVSSKA